MKRSFYIKVLYMIITLSWRLIRAYCKHHSSYSTTRDHADDQGLNSSVDKENTQKGA